MMYGNNFKRLWFKLNQSELIEKMLIYLQEQFLDANQVDYRGNGLINENILTLSVISVHHL